MDVVCPTLAAIGERRFSVFRIRPVLSDGDISEEDVLDVSALGEGDQPFVRALTEAEI